MIKEFSLKRDQIRNGIRLRLKFNNGNGVSIINGKGIYCDDKTFEIAPIINDSLVKIDSWGDKVKGYVTSKELSLIIGAAERFNNDAYREFLNSFEFSNDYKPDLEDILKSIVSTNE